MSTVDRLARYALAARLAAVTGPAVEEPDVILFSDLPRRRRRPGRRVRSDASRSSLEARLVRLSVYQPRQLTAGTFRLARGTAALVAGAVVGAALALGVASLLPLGGKEHLTCSQNI